MISSRLLEFQFDKIKKILYNISVKIKEEKFFMKRKELKALAAKIAKCEIII